MTELAPFPDVSSLRKVWGQLGALIDGMETISSDTDQPFTTTRQVVSPKAASEGELTFALAKELYRLRRKRNDFFPSHLFADPSWDIILDLYVLQHQGKRASVKSVCIASGVPPTTALRWIGMLVKEGLLERTIDDADQRVRWIALTPAGFKAMHSLLLSTVAPSLVGSNEAYDAKLPLPAVRASR